MKKCKSCQLELEDHFYYPAPKTKDGLRSTCIGCCKKRQKLWREKNPDYHRKWREANPNYQADWRAKRKPQASVYAAVRSSGSSRAFSARSILGQILLMNPCVDCGEEDVLTLEFDHIEDKEFNIGATLRGSPWKPEFWTEIDKCDIVCANCHKKRTARRCSSWRLSL